MKKTNAFLAILALSGTAALAQDRPSSMTISTASPGGTYAVYGEGIANLISDVVGIPTSSRQTQGPAQNMVLVNGGQSELGMTTSGPAFEAVTGALELNPGVEHSNVRALFAMYPTPFQIVTLEGNNIESFGDLNGKRLGSGPRAGTGGTYWPRWLEALGYTSDMQFGGIGDQAAQLADGRLDAMVTAGGVPLPAISELESTQDAKILSIPEDILGDILKANPYAVPFTIAQGVYTTPTEDISTAAMWNFVVASADLPDDVAYEITKAVLENNERMVATHSAARQTLAENIVNNTVVPLHPGAVRYYEEIGIEIPEAIMPAAN